MALLVMLLAILAVVAHERRHNLVATFLAVMAIGMALWAGSLPAVGVR